MLRMRKWIIKIGVLMCLAGLLTGCGSGQEQNPGAEQGTGTHQSETLPEGAKTGGEMDENAVFTEIPDMMVSYGDTTLAEKHSLGSWSYLDSKDEWIGYSADGLHPLQWDYEEYGVVLDNVGGEIKVSFTLAPEQVEVTYWEYNSEQEYDIAAMENGVKAEVSTQNDGSYSFAVPGEGTYVLMIYPTWNAPKCNGDGIFGILLRGAEQAHSQMQEKTDLILRTEQDKYSTDTNVITYYIQNNTDEMYATGTNFLLLKKQGEEWVEKSFAENLAFEALGIMIKSGGEAERSFDIKACFGETLAPGEYRLHVTVWQEDDAEKKVELSAGFQVVE